MDIVNDSIFSKVVEALLMDYESIYYVNTLTDEYAYYSLSDQFKSLQLRESGLHFFEKVGEDAKKVVHPDDLKFFTDEMQKDNMQWSTHYDTIDTHRYRLMIDGKPVWHMLRILRGYEKQEDYIIIGVMNIDEQVRLEESQKELDSLKGANKEFIDATVGLVNHYDALYYVNLVTNVYVQLHSSNLLGVLSGKDRQTNFFERCAEDIDIVIHPDDREQLHKFFDKNDLLDRLNRQQSMQLRYRIMNGSKTTNVRLIAIMTRDAKHLLLCVENLDNLL